MYMGCKMTSRNITKNHHHYNSNLLYRLLFLIPMFLFCLTAARPVHADDLIPHLDVFDFTTYDMKPKTESVDNANWKVQLKNATCQTPIQVDVSSLLGKRSTASMTSSSKRA